MRLEKRVDALEEKAGLKSTRPWLTTSYVLDPLDDIPKTAADAVSEYNTEHGTDYVEGDFDVIICNKVVEPIVI